jgi:hypothetical protein
MNSTLLRAEEDDAPAGEDQAAAVREAVQRLVALDVANGGDQTSILATRALRAAEPMLAPGAYDPRAERPVLDQDRLTPRLGAMFQLRVARAYAQMGLRHLALKTLDTARGLFYEGTSARDPAWSWWISAPVTGPADAVGRVSRSRPRRPSTGAPHVRIAGAVSRSRGRTRA